MLPAYTIFPLGDGALTVDFGNRIDEALNRRVLRLFHRLQNASPFFLDVVPAYASLTIFYDVVSLRTRHRSAFDAAKAMVEPLLNEEAAGGQTPSRQVAIPVCYEPRFAPDMAGLAAAKNLSVADAVRLHTAAVYRVYLIGFLPGFAYMGKVDSRLAVPRKAQPRTEVPAGAVGIAGGQTGIYPLASPGGWNIVGRTPLKMFDAGKAEPVLLRPGDDVRFYSITEDEFEDRQSRNS